MTYVPSKQILERYARLLVQFGLGKGEGIKPGETVMVTGEEDTKPLFFEVCREVWRNGGHVIQRYRAADDSVYNFEAAFFELASDDQLEHFAEHYNRGLIDETDHIIFITGERDPQAAKGIDPARRAKQAPALEKYWEMRNAKERAGKLGWTLAGYGTEAMATEAGMTIEEYWEQIINACFLDDADPVARWREATAQIARYRDWLNSLDIDRMHLEAEGIDLWLTLGEKRRWIDAEGANIPSFEIFTAPDWRGTNGTIKFSEPLYYYGRLIKGVELEFKDGEVIRADAEEGAADIQQMVAEPGANRLGEFSLTDARLSRITRFMADTLYDENVGGRFGNTHMAIGLAITEALDGDEEALSDDDWEALGFNVKSSLHCDIVSTTDRTVTATLRDGSTRVIYADGKFQVD